MRDRVCRGCSKPIRGMGSRCPPCQAIERFNRKADKASFPKPKKEKPGRNPDHLAWIRTLPCAACGRPEPSEAAHVRVGTGGGMGLKPPDRWTLPLCGGGCHREQHRIGHSAFDEKYGLDSRALAERYAASSPFLCGSPEW